MTAREHSDLLCVRESPRIKFWRFQLEAAMRAHQAELTKMNGPGLGASLRELDRLARRAERANRELRKAEKA